MIMIGGATRNVGKTSLTGKILKKLSAENYIIGLKIKTLYTGDHFFHGKDRHPLADNEKYRIIEEFDNTTAEDTAKMLLAGAKRVFRIKVKSEFIADAIQELNAKIQETPLFICESNSLRTVVKPGVFLMIKHQDGRAMKPSAKRLQQFADRIILTDGKKHDFDIASIAITKNTWKLME